MNISSVGLTILKNTEGFVDHVYPDSHGRDAIGYGHNLHPGESYPNGITQDQGMDLLDQVPSPRNITNTSRAGAEDPDPRLPAALIYTENALRRFKYEERLGSLVGVAK